MSVVNLLQQLSGRHQIDGEQVRCAGTERAAALACGNAVIIKPSDLTALTTLKFVEAFAMLPPGLVQVLAGGARVGQQLRCCCFSPSRRSS